MLRLTILVLAIASGAFAAVKPMLDGRIVGGEIVNIADYPYQVSLQYNGGHFCGGSILNRRWILSAAHCTEGDAPSSLQIRAGSSYRNSGGVLYQVDRNLIHPQWNRTDIDFDYTLLRVNQDIVFGEGVQPVPYHTQDATLTVGEILRVSGWGNTQVSGDDLTLLRAVSVPKVDHAVCGEAYAKYGDDAISPQMLCAGFTEGGRDACQGDSGGPLVDNRGVLVGVVSWGEGCALPTYPGVYSRVASVGNWIAENILDLN